MNKDYGEVEYGLDKLKEIVSGAAIIVEGKRDKSALESLGFGNIVTCIGNSERIVQTVERMGFERAIVLTDFDDEGDRKNCELTDYLRCYGIKVMHSARSYFAKTFRVKTVEEMVYYSRKGYCDSTLPSSERV